MMTKRNIKNFVLVIILTFVSYCLIKLCLLLDVETLQDFTTYFLHKRAIDRQCQEVFCERLQPGMDVKTVKAIILEEYDVKFIFKVNWTGLEGDKFMAIQSQENADFFVFGKPSVYLLFNEGKYVLTYVSEFDSGYILCEEKGK